MSDIGVPPATGVWYDLDATVAAVLATLRLAGGDVDTSRIRALIPAAAVAIDHYVDRVTVLDGPPPAPDIQYALERYTVELYRTDQPTAGNQYLPLPTETYLRALLDSLIAGRRERWAVA